MRDKNKILKCSGFFMGGVEMPIKLADKDVN